MNKPEDQAQIRKKNRNQIIISFLLILVILCLIYLSVNIEVLPED